MSSIARALSLRPGDFARGLPLFAYHFLVILFYMMGRVARDAIFLDHFNAAQLPYADIASASLAAVFVALYIRAGHRASLAALQVGSLLFFAANLVALWWGLHVRALVWVPPLFYIWLGVVGVLAVAQVWTLANFVWTTREAKRLFGVLGSAGIAGGIGGGFLAKGIAHRIGTDATLLVMAAVLIASAALVPIVWSRRAATQEPHPTAHGDGSPRGLLESIRLVARSPHLRAIATLILFSSIVTTAAGWQLKAIAKETLVHKDALAAYLGAFAGYTGIVSLAAQLGLTAFVLRRFGVGIALLILPTFLVLGSAAVAVWGTLWAATMLKGGDAAFRYSVDTSAVQLLYLPVRGGIKVQVKSFIDTVVWKIGDGLAGLTLLVFVTRLHFTPRQISWVTFVLLAGWIGAAFVARRQYVATLRANIQQTSLAPGGASVPVLDQITTGVFAEKLGSADPQEVLYALALFEVGQQLQSHGAIRGLLGHPSPDVRRKAIAILDSAEDRTVLPQVAELLRDEHLDVRTEALLYLTRHDAIDPLAHIERLGDFADFSIRSSAIAFLARPGASQNLDAAQMMLESMIREAGEAGRATRLEAARLLASLPDEFESRLATLLDDPDPEVQTEAVRAIGQRRARCFVPALIDRLGTPACAADATEALTLFEDAVVNALRERLLDPDTGAETRQEIVHVLLRIGTRAAGVVLTEALLESDVVLRYRIICALNKLQDVRQKLPIDRQMVETVMIAELMGHYRSYQILGTFGGVADKGLDRAMRHELERIFRLMKLLFPAIDLKNAYAGIQSLDPVMNSNALEFLDNTLDPRLRSLLVPLLDRDVTTRERIHLADRFLGFSVPATAPAPHTS